MCCFFVFLCRTIRSTTAPTSMQPMWTPCMLSHSSHQTVSLTTVALPRHSDRPVMLFYPSSHLHDEMPSGKKSGPALVLLLVCLYLCGCMVCAVCRIHILGQHFERSISRTMCMDVRKQCMPLSPRLQHAHSVKGHFYCLCIVWLPSFYSKMSVL